MPAGRAAGSRAAAAGHKGMGFASFVAPAAVGAAWLLKEIKSSFTAAWFLGRNNGELSAMRLG